MGKVCFHMMPSLFSFPEAHALEVEGMDHLGSNYSIDVNQHPFPMNNNEVVKADLFQ